MTNQDAGQLRVATDPIEALEEYVIPDPYEAWIQREGIKQIVDFAFDDLNALELGPWERKGGKGAVLDIPGDQLPCDAHVVEISPGGKSEPEHHMYEEVFYVLSGRGATSVWADGEHPETFEWNQGSLFAVPLNAWYQIFNGSGSEPARYVSMTSAPPMMRLFRDEDFMWNNPFVFRSRLTGASSTFAGEGKLFKERHRRVWESNFIPNAVDMGLYTWKERGAGGINAEFQMAKHSVLPHISEFPVGTYKKAHRHGPGAHLILLRGTGYSLLSKEGEEPRMAPWKENAMVVVPEDDCVHQHFNTGTTPARYLALKPSRHGLFRPTVTTGKGDVSMKQGGIQIEYEDEDRKIHEIFEAELERNGAPCRMKAFVPWCTGEVGPTSERDT
jgi:oxalate decarboxylase/phosphoglucose isomerase-like protein (cupin superfamily)